MCKDDKLIFFFFKSNLQDKERVVDETRNYFFSLDYD